MINSSFSYDIICYCYSKVDDIYVYAIGCELSVYDANKIVEIFNKQKTHCIIVSTCAVTENSFIISLNLVKILKAIYPTYEIVITGCAVNYCIDAFKNYGACHTNEDKMSPLSYKLKDCYNANFDHSCEDNLGYVKIQDGCSSSCNYCIVPKLRNKPFSVDYSIIKNDIQNLLNQKCTHIRLVATEVCNYASNGLFLPELVEKILIDFPEITKLSFNAIDPTNVRIVKKVLYLSTIYKLLQDELMLSILSGSNTVLLLMNRHNTVDNTREIMNYAKLLNVPVSWHLIIGYPGETDDLFNETYELIKELKPKSVSLHPFSVRKNTVAEKLTNIVPKTIVDSRIILCKQLINTYSKKLYLHNDMKSYLTSIVTEFRNDIRYDSKSMKFYNIYDIFSLYLCLDDCNKTKNIHYIFDTLKDNELLELITKIIVFHTNKYVLNMHCTVNNRFLEYCKSIQLELINSLGYKFLSNIFLNFNTELLSLSVDNWKYLMQLIDLNNIKDIKKPILNILINDANYNVNVSEIYKLFTNV